MRYSIAQELGIHPTGLEAAREGRTGPEKDEGVPCRTRDRAGRHGKGEREQEAHGRNPVGGGGGLESRGERMSGFVAVKQKRKP